ncbi:MAG: ABC transporter ATP-binding protein [Flavobacteriaceae bacterium]|jgi:lipoprotein-releasing system ATP-binding protein|nr:ABC transporter ATP-binding protein [Flavobacteriaceae bacterium]MDG1963088.1 ABC transporter ATP-binding protein [Flavobacteriaceae bacterium]
MIKAIQIEKSYRSLKVLKGVDLEVTKGEIVSVVGASGAGKTTLLHVMGTLDRMDKGQLTINGTDPFELSQKALAHFRNNEIGFIFQFHQLLPEFTAIENVCMPALIQNTPMKKAQDRAKELLAFLGLQDRWEHKPKELSGGEQQRVAVARALMNRPSLILADEPSGNLDTESAAALHELFFDLRKEFGQTFIIVTHNMELAQMADRQLIMENGVFKKP